MKTKKQKELQTEGEKLPQSFFCPQVSLAGFKGLCRLWVSFFIGVQMVKLNLCCKLWRKIVGRLAVTETTESSMIDMYDTTLDVLFEEGMKCCPVCGNEIIEV